MIKLTKRLSAFLAVLTLIVCTPLCVFAESSQKLDDSADLFSTQQEAELTSQLLALSEESQWDVVVYTCRNNVDSDDMESYYNQYYDDMGFGIGKKKSGVIFVIDMGSGNRVINTKGEAMYYFDDDRMTQIKSNLKPYLSSNDYYGATEAFINTTKSYYEQGMTEDGSYENVKINEKEDNPFLYVVKYYGVIILLIALAVSAITVVFIYLKYKNNGKEGTYDLGANSHTDITTKQDIFIEKHTTVTTVSSSSSGGGGGSSGGGGGGGSSHGSSGSF